MNKLYVIGNNASKSLSPTIFKYWFKKYKIKATYGYYEINKKFFNKEIKQILIQKNLLGLNITIPYKKDIIRFVDVLDKHASKIEAVNCVIFKKNTTRGINTDWIGYKKSLTGFKINKKKKVLMLGYGGAGMAIYYSLKKTGFKNIIVFNQTRRIIKNSLGGKYTKKFNKLDDHLSDASLIINTTPVNIITNSQKKLISPKTIISDIVYSPKNTKFLKQFKTNKKIYGILMLVNQAIPCFKEWFGFEPEIDKRLLNILDKKTK